MAKIKGYAKQVLRRVLERRRHPKGLLERLSNRIGYTDALTAKYGILMVAGRRRLDKENPNSLISSLEEKLSLQVKELISALNLPEKVYWPWMSVFSYPSSRDRDCHPWITRFQEVLGTGSIEAAKRVRGIMNLYRSAALRWIETHLSSVTVEELKSLIERVKRIHFWSERDELEEAEDLALTNLVIDNFCPHRIEHRSLSDIRKCPYVKHYLEPGKLRKLRLALYIFLDDYGGFGRELRRMSSDLVSNKSKMI